MRHSYKQKEEEEAEEEEEEEEEEEDEEKRLNKLLPEALLMFLNGERRKDLFTSDHIRSLLRLHLDDTSFDRGGTCNRKYLLSELERKNAEEPDLFQVTARLYL